MNILTSAHGCDEIILIALIYHRAQPIILRHLCSTRIWRRRPSICRPYHCSRTARFNLESLLRILNVEFTWSASPSPQTWSNCRCITSHRSIAVRCNRCFAAKGMRRIRGSAENEDSLSPKFIKTSPVGRARLE